MKTRFILPFLFTVFILNTVSAQISGTDLIAYYPLRRVDVTTSGQYTNLASNNYHLSSTVSPSIVAGRNGVENLGNGAISLSGGTVQLNHNYASNALPFQQLTNFAIGAWATTTIPSFTNEYQNIVMVGNNDIFIRYRKNGTSYSIQAGFRHSTTNFAVLNYSIVSPSNFFEDMWGNPAWHHFALHRGNGTLELFVDGVNVAATSISSAITHSATNQSFKIGHGVDVNTHLNGKISDVFYYARSLNPADLTRFTCDKANENPIGQTFSFCNVVSSSLSTNLPTGATSYSWYTTPFDGAPIHIGDNYPTGTINTTTTYYVDATYSGGCSQRSYPRAPVKIEINSPASAPTNTTPSPNQTICAGTSTTLSASSIAPVIRWYDDPTAGTLLNQNATTFTTPILNTTTTYYVASFVPGCGESSRTAIQVTVNPNTTPATPTIITSVLTTCGNNSMTLIANTPGTTIRWYDASTGGNLLHTGTNYITPVLPNPTVFEGQDTYTYYVESSTTCGGSSARVPVTITVKYQYSLSAVASAITVCEGESATLAITTNAAQSTTGWIQGFSQVATNTFTYTTPALFSATGYMASIQPSNGCAAYANFTITTTTAQQTAPTTTTPGANLVVCNGNSTTLSATGSGTIYWFDAPTNGTLLSTGNSYATGNLTSNSTFYAQNGGGVCASNRIPVSVTVNQPATGIDVQTACSSFSWIDGNNYTNSNNTATHIIVNGAANGCDSIVTLNLTINQPATGVDVLTACGSFEWIDGNNYNSTNNTATHTIDGGAANGCDSIVTLNLTIIQPTTGIDVQTSCGTFEWIDGNTYSSSNNTATHTIVDGAANGCDSIVTLNLTINQPGTSSLSETACDSYTWLTGNGETYTSSTMATHIIPSGSINGCDSIVTLDLTIHTINNVVLINGTTLTAQQSGATYQWLDCDNANEPIDGATSQSFSPTISGNYAVEITLNGCTDVTNCTAVTVNTSSIEEQTGTEFYFFPNPVKDELTLANLTIGSTLQVTDMTGKIVFETIVSTNEMNVDLNQLTNGVYFIQQLNIEGETPSKKLIVSK